MAEEEESNNKDTKEEETDNKVSENLPEEETEVKSEEKPKEEAQDPEMAKWIEDTGSLENAYKRNQGGQEEVEKFKNQADESGKKLDEYQQQMAQELRAIYDKDPKAAAKLFGMELPKEGEEQTEQQPVDPKQLAKEAAIEARADIEVETFYERNQAHFKSEDDWKDTKDIALSFVGKKDGEGKPYTIQTALRDATLLRKPDLIGDKAISDHLTSEAIRASASESGDTPTGNAAEGGKQNDEQDELAEQLGMNLDDEARDRIAQRQREKEAQ